jgi:DNA-binding NtrC family response regulator
VEPNALVVDDRNESREMVAEDMARAGFRITEASNGVDGWQRFQNCRPDLVVSDLTMPGAGGIDLLKRIREVSSVPVILFSATGDVRAAVEAIKAGAQEFYRFPTDRVRMMDRAQALASGRSELSRLESQLVGSSAAMRRVRERVCALAPLRVPVLVSGDSGTGRDRVVRCLADLASGQFSRLVKVTRKTAGDVRQPDRQVAYYLDGFDAFSPADQVRWLDAVRDVGGDAASDVPRVFASTARNPERLEAITALRPDSCERLLRFEVPLVPLRERRGDIPALSLHLAARISADMGREQVRVDPGAIDLFGAQAWTGNVRELSEVIEKLVAFSPGGHVTAERVRETFGEARSGVAELREQRKQRQHDELVELLETCGGNIAEVARRLGLSRGAVIYRAQKHGLLPRGG